jgi:hypothetical protein
VSTLKKTETSQISNLIMHLKILEKQEQTKPKTSRQREIVKTMAEINVIETKQSIQIINETKVGSLKRLTKSTNP